MTETLEGRTRARDQPLVFNHIPKTAGTSLHAALMAYAEPNVGQLFFDHCGFGSFTAFETINRRHRRRIVDSPCDLPAGATFVSGHITPSTTMARYPNADHLTVLREPRVRILSLWLFSRAHTDFMLRRWGGFVEWLRASRAPLVDYLNRPLVASQTDNVITRYLVWPHSLVPDADFIETRDDDELFGTAVARLERFAHVGLAEDSNFARTLSEWIGRPLVLGRYQEAGPQPAELRPDVTSEVAAAHDALQVRSRIDIRIWEHAARTIFPHEDLGTVRDRVFAEAVQRYCQTVALSPRRGVIRAGAERGYDLQSSLRRELRD